MSRTPKNGSRFDFYLPGARVKHQDLNIEGTVLSCINFKEVADRICQGPRYYIAINSHVFSVTQDKLELMKQGEGLSDYHRKRFSNYLISGDEISDFPSKKRVKRGVATLGTP